jgi:hypothetical protein
MFFEDPVSAFRNLLRATKPNGVLCFTAWQAITSNPWMLVPAAAAARHIEMPAPPAPDAPGPFAFADGARVVSILEDAGWSKIECVAHAGELAVGLGQKLPEIIGFLQQMGPAGNALRDATPAVRAKVGETMREVLAPYYKDDALRMQFATWIVTATRAA